MTTTQTYAKDYDGAKSPNSARFTDTTKASDSVSSPNEGVAHLAQHLKEDTLEIVKSANSQTQRKMRDLKTFASDSFKSIEKEVSAKPVQSVAISFAVGALLSHLLARR